MFLLFHEETHEQTERNLTMHFLFVKMVCCDPTNQVSKQNARMAKIVFIFYPQRKEELAWSSLAEVQPHSLL